MPHPSDPVLTHLTALYGDSTGRRTFERLRSIMETYRGVLGDARTGSPLTERDALLITYADQLREPGRPPLQTLADFCERHLAGLISGIHILPFYPSSSDGGFSVDRLPGRRPGPGRLGGCRPAGSALPPDVRRGHQSCLGPQRLVPGLPADDPRYRDFFVTVDGAPDLSSVVRPRALPLLTRFETAAGLRQVWTTFSDDQADLNYKNPDVLLEIIDALLFYVSQGPSSSVWMPSPTFGRRSAPPASTCRRPTGSSSSFAPSWMSLRRASG